MVVDDIAAHLTLALEPKGKDASLRRILLKLPGMGGGAYRVLEKAAKCRNLTVPELLFDDITGVGSPSPVLMASFGQFACVCPRSVKAPR